MNRMRFLLLLYLITTESQKIYGLPGSLQKQRSRLDRPTQLDIPELSDHHDKVKPMQWFDPAYHSFVEFFSRKRKLTGVPYTFVETQPQPQPLSSILNDNQKLPTMGPTPGQITKACVNPSMIQMVSHPNCSAIIKHFQDSLLKLKNEYKGKSDLAGSEFQESKHTPIGISHHFDVNNEFDNKLHDNNVITAPTEIAAENADAEFHGAAEILNIPLAVSHSFFKVSITLTGLEAIKKGMLDVNKKNENTLSEQKLDSTNKRKASLEFALSIKHANDYEVVTKLKKLEREAELATYKYLAGLDAYNKCKVAFSALLPLLQQQISNIEHQYNSCVGTFGQIQNMAQDPSKPLVPFSFDTSMSQGLTAMDSDLNMVQSAISDITHDSIKHSGSSVAKRKKKCCKRGVRGGRGCNTCFRRYRGGANALNLSILLTIATLSIFIEN